MIIIFHQEIVENLIPILSKTHFSFKNAKIFLFLILPTTSGTLLYPHFFHLSLPTVSQQPYLQLNLNRLLKTFASNPTLYSDIIFFLQFSSNLLISSISISTKDAISALSDLNSKKAYDNGSILPVISELVLPRLDIVLVNYFIAVYQFLSLFPVGR